MGSVTLLSCTPNPEKVVACSAKLCYSNSTIDGIMDGLDDEKVSSFVEMLSDIGHESPIEHASYTFGISGISRSCLAQITRHRMASYSVQSQRYVNESEIFDYVIPPQIESNEEAKEEFVRIMKETKSSYDKLSKLLKDINKKELIDNGKSEKSADKAAEKKAIEDARFVLPNACVTKMICTMNARSLLNFFRHRCCMRAQWEIRDIAMQMFELVLKESYDIFKNAGPACLRGKCPEGKMCCGKAGQVKEMFESIKKLYAKEELSKEEEPVKEESPGEEEESFNEK